MAEVKQRFDLDLSGTISGLEKVAGLVSNLDSDLDRLGTSQKSSFKASSDAIQDFNRNLGTSTSHYRKIESGTRGLRKEQEGLRTTYERLTRSQREFTNGAKYNALQKEITDLKKRVEQLNGELGKSEKASSGFGSAMGKIGGVLAGIFAVDQVIEFGKKVFGITAEFQKYNAVLTNSLGSSKKAAEAMAMIKDFASATPFAVNEITDSYVKLAGRGIQPTREQLTKMGDVAAATGKDMSQLTEALMDVNNTERWNELGIKVKTEGDKMTGTFRGLKIEVEKSEAGAIKMIEAFGGMAGVAGTMSSISETLGGKLSNLGDTFDSLLLTIGERLVPVFSKAMAGISFLMSGLTELIGVKEDTNRVSLDVIAQNQKEASSAKGLLARYEELEKKGVKATKKEKKELDIITLKLRDSLGESVTAINKETGALELNKEAVKEAIKQKLLMANQEASTLALRVNAIDEEIKAQEGANKSLQSIDATRNEILKRQGLTIKEANDLVTRAATGERFIGPMKEDLKVAQQWFEANRQANQGLEKNNALQKERREILEGLKKLGFSAADVDKLFSDALANEGGKTEPVITELSDKEKKAREAALKDLKSELERLEKEANQARISMLDKNSKEYLEALYKERQKEIKEIEDTIKKKEKLAGKDGKLDAEQIKQIGILKTAAAKEYQDALFELEQGNRDKLLDLQKDSDEKAMQQLVNKYDAEIRAARKAGNEEIAIALETAKRRDAAKLGRTQEMGNLDFQEQLSTEGAKLDINKLDGVDEVEKERLLKEKLLQIEEDFALKRLQVLQGATDDEALLEQLQLKNKLEEIRNARELMEQESEGFSIQKLLGLTDEQMEGVNIATEQLLGQLQDFLAASVELRQREVEALTQAIDEKGEELAREIDLNKEGFASNVETKRQEYEELKKQRKKAQEDQARAQKAQVALDTVTQSVNMITAATDIFKSVSSIPIVGVPLAIGLIATMFAAFAASKAKAMQAASVPTYEKGGEGSLIKGASHKQGGIDIVERKSGRLVANMQGGENFYVTNNKATDAFWPYLELINKQDKKGFLSLALDELLQGTGVVPHPELPKRMQTVQQGAKQAQYQQVNDALLKEMNGHLKKVATNTAPNTVILDTPDFTEYRTGNTTRRVRK